MSNEYLPPIGTKLPFNFTESGYLPPNSKNVYFNFVPKFRTGTLKAAVNVLQPYWYETHTYSKECPKYVVGYGFGGIQIIKGRCLFGGIRDLRGSIIGQRETSAEKMLASIIDMHIPDNLSSYIEMHSPRDINAYVGTHQPVDLVGILEGVKNKGLSNLSAYTGAHIPDNLSSYIEMHSPRDINAYVGTHQPVDLVGILEGVKNKGLSNLSAYTGAHIPDNLSSYIGTHSHVNLGMHLGGTHAPEILRVSIKSWQSGYSDLNSFIYSSKKNAFKLLQAIVAEHTPDNLVGVVGTHLPYNLSGNIHSWVLENLGMVFGGTHDPINLHAYVDVAQREVRVLSALIRGWQQLDLSAFINIVHLHDLPAMLQSIPPKNLPAYLKVYPQSILSANTYGWKMFNLGATIKHIYDIVLHAKIHGRDDMFSNLQAKLKGVGTSVVRNLTAFVRNMHHNSLPAYLRSTYIGDIQAYLYAIRPRDLDARVHAWHVIDLQGIINGNDYPWSLTAEIYSAGEWILLSAKILARAAVAVYTGLKASVHPWEIRNLTSSITGANANFLRAMIEPLGYSSDLHAKIRPKMIRLTTVIDILTMNHSDLSAIINYPCFKTGWSDLGSYVYPTFKSDLYAYLKVIKYNYKPALLGAKTGYTDSISEVDKLKLCITIYPNEVISEDKLKVYFTIFSAGNLLSAYIKSIMRHKQLTATIIAEDLEHFVYPTPIKNREVVVHKTYDGIFKQFEYVEFAFKSIVKDYYYSSDGDYAWKKDRVDRWILDVKSYLPTDTSLKLKRRLHRATTLYDFRKFQSVDAAMKYAIAYVTEYPQGNLGATIWNRSRYEVLTSTINPRYTHSDLTGLGANIVPEGSTIVLSAGGEISKI